MKWKKLNLLVLVCKDIEPNWVQLENVAKHKFRENADSHHLARKKMALQGIMKLKYTSYSTSYLPNEMNRTKLKV